MHIIIIKTIFCVNDSPKKNIKLSFFKLVVYSLWKRFSVKLSPTHANNSKVMFNPHMHIVIQL